MQYQMKQKLWAMGDDFTIKNGAGEDVFFATAVVIDLVNDDEKRR